MIAMTHIDSDSLKSSLRVFCRGKRIPILYLFSMEVLRSLRRNDAIISDVQARKMTFLQRNLFKGLMSAARFVLKRSGRPGEGP